MQYDQNNPDEFEETGQRGNRWNFGWIREAFTRSHSDDDEACEEEPEPEYDGVARLPQPSRASGGSNSPIRKSPAPPTLRLEAARRSRVTVRRTVQSFEDVRRAVDGLREGIQQIVNLEQTPADMAERLIDFMNGATYAIDGSVEKIGEHVYLFTPPTVTIEIDDRSQSALPKAPFFDKD